MMDGLPAGAAVPICSPFGRTLYPQFTLSGPQITLRNQTKEAVGETGGGTQWLPEESGEGRHGVGVPMV